VLGRQYRVWYGWSTARPPHGPPGPPATVADRSQNRASRRMGGPRGSPCAPRACCLDAAPMPSVKRPPRAVWAVIGLLRHVNGMPPVQRHHRGPQLCEVRCIGAQRRRAPTMGWTAIAWETQRLSKPDASAHRAAARTSSTVARVVPPARPHRTPNLSLANVCSLLPLSAVAKPATVLIHRPRRAELKSLRVSYSRMPRSPGPCTGRAMEPHTCS